MDVFATFAQQPVVLAFILPLGIIAAARPVWAIYWLLLFVSTHRALYALGALTTGTKVLLDDGIVVAILMGSLVAAARRRSLTATEAAVPLGALILIVLVSAMANDTPLLTVIYGIRFSLLYTVLFFAIRNASIGARAVRQIMNLAIALGAINAAIGTAQFLGILPLWPLVATAEQHRIGSFYRATGLLGGAGDLGAYLVALTCLASAMVTPGASGRRVQNIHKAAVVIMTLGIVCTASRAAVVAMIVGVLGVAASLRRGRAFIAVTGLMVGSMVLLIPVIAERFTVLPREYGLGSTLRAFYFYTALDLWKAHPLLGVGMGAYGGGAGSLLPNVLADEVGVYSQIDNSVLGILVQIGAVGFLAFGWLVIRIARHQLRIVREHERFPRALATAALATMAAMVPLSLAGPSLEQHGFALFFWSLPALSSVVARRAAATLAIEGEPAARAGSNPSQVRERSPR